MSFTSWDELRMAVAQNKLEAVADHLLERSQQDPLLKPWRESAIQLAGQYRDYEDEKRNQTTSSEALRHQKNQVRASMLDLLEEMEASSTQAVQAVAETAVAGRGGEVAEAALPAKASGIREERLKLQVFALLVLTKGSIVIFVFTLWQSGSFSPEQFLATLGVIVPIFATYLGLVIKEYLERGGMPQPNPKQLTRGFQWTAYGLLATYGLAFLIILNLRGPGIIDQTDMMSLLTLLESGLGVYVGRLMVILFRPVKEETD